MYVYCIYRVISKAPKKLPNFLERAETSVVLIVKSALISINDVTVFYLLVSEY
jgi:hypothetical protein